MPWRATCPMDQKRDFILAWRSHTVSRTALCRLFGISRQIGYKWVHAPLARTRAARTRVRRPRDPSSCSVSSRSACRFRFGGRFC